LQFDTPLDFNQVFSLAAQFITGFAPGDPPLPFKAFPPLMLEASRYPYTAGSSPVTFKNAYANALKAGLVANKGTPVYAVFFSGLDVYYVPVYITQGDKDVSISAILFEVFTPKEKEFFLLTVISVFSTRSSLFLAHRLVYSHLPGRFMLF
jgi:hypothetical protein